MPTFWERLEARKGNTAPEPDVRILASKDGRRRARLAAQDEPEPFVVPPRMQQLLNELECSGSADDALREAMKMAAAVRNRSQKPHGAARDSQQGDKHAVPK